MCISLVNFSSLKFLKLYNTNECINKLKKSYRSNDANFVLRVICFILGNIYNVQK